MQWAPLGKRAKLNSNFNQLSPPPPSGQHLPVIKVLVLHVQQVLQSWLEAEATQLSGPHFALIDYLDYFS